MTKLWGDKRYYSLNHYLREKFGEKVFKISLDAGFTCPNRDGKISTGGCIFCSERGSGDFTGSSSNIVKQFFEVKDMMNKKWKSDKYIAYFQAYTNTYAPVEVLREKYMSVLELEGVVGIAIATRPDCLSDEVLNLLDELNKKTYLWVELGLQTTNEDTAKIINRGYNIETYIKAVNDLKKRNIEVVTHVILGLPGEDYEDIINSIKFVANTGTKGIKLQLMHLMKDTKMVEMYERGEMSFLSKDEYCDLILKCIEILPPDMVVHRITGDSPRKLLIEPMWSLKKWEVLNSINEGFIKNDTWQGKLYEKDESIQKLFLSDGYHC